MNRIHHWICSSKRWKRILSNEIFSRVFAGVDLGKNVLEIRPGPGHIPTPMLQDRLFAEIHRVLRPGAVFVGMDVVDTWSLRLMHWGDSLVPIDPAHLAPRLRRAGFEDTDIETEKHAFRFSARGPA